MPDGSRLYVEATPAGSLQFVLRRSHSHHHRDHHYHHHHHNDRADILRKELLDRERMLRKLNDSLSRENGALKAAWQACDAERLSLSFSCPWQSKPKPIEPLVWNSQPLSACDRLKLHVKVRVLEQEYRKLSLSWLSLSKSLPSLVSLADEPRHGREHYPVTLWASQSSHEAHPKPRHVPSGVNAHTLALFDAETDEVNIPITACHDPPLSHSGVTELASRGFYDLVIANKRELDRRLRKAYAEREAENLLRIHHQTPGYLTRAPERPPPIQIFNMPTTDPPVELTPIPLAREIRNSRLLIRQLYRLDIILWDQLVSCDSGPSDRPWPAALTQLGTPRSLHRMIMGDQARTSVVDDREQLLQDDLLDTHVPRRPSQDVVAALAPYMASWYGHPVAVLGRVRN